MKNKLYLILAGLFLLAVQVKAQAPNSFNYRGIGGRQDSTGIKTDLFTENVTTNRTGNVYSGWTVTNPFEHHVFIENKGQFTEEEKKYIDQPILFYNRLGKIQMYFSASSITFRYDSIVKTDDDDISQNKLKDPDQDKNLKDVPQFLKMTWQNTNPGAEIEVQDPEKDYFTYGNPSDKSGHSGIVAHAWKKLIYHNIYKGIDIEFTDYPFIGK